MNLLLVHQNFPGQYLHLARYFGAQPQHRVVFVTQRAEGELPRVRKLVYRPRRPASPHTHRYLTETEAAVLNAQEVARSCIDLRNAGFVPELILGHNGWGEIWYLKDIFPRAVLVGYFEFFYRVSGADVGFDPTDPPTPDTAPRIRTKNLGNLLGLEAADWGQTPTRWQKSRYPERYQSMLHVLHEGIDTAKVTPDRAARLALDGEIPELAAGDEIVTYVARNLEPYRGFPTFMRSIPAILAARPKARILIVGGDEVSYGLRPTGPMTFREQLTQELCGSYDETRLHFLGRVPYSTFLQILKVSRVHVYLTFPFVQSLSMLEAMAAGCLVIGSRTAPVQEFIEDGVNGLLVDFFSHADVAARVIEALAAPRAHDRIRKAARARIVEHYDLHSRCLPAFLELLATLVPPPVR